MTKEKTLTPDVKNETMTEVGHETGANVRGQSQSPVPETAPEVNIYTDAEFIYLEGNVPGVDETSLDISFEKNTLTIFGKNQNPLQPASENYSLEYAEFRNGNYRRSFQFYENIDADAIEASIKNGVLKLKIPVKKPEIKKINVKVD